MLDDSVMFARRLRALGQPVTLRVVQDLPHGFLSLSQLCRETRQASALCTELIREILLPQDEIQPPPPAASASFRKHRKLERTCPAGAAPSTGAQDNSTQIGQEGEGETLGGSAGPTGPAIKVVPDALGLPAGSDSAAEQPGEAGSHSSPDLTAVQDTSSSGGAVGRGVGA